ncbi:hypothetical protein FRC00_010273 [Tulasnella sp. 408]|nr:hypothetical protein FRC00_010273 [Tulasnella sp. 408]
MSSISTPFTESAPAVSPLVSTPYLRDSTEERHSDLYFYNFIDVKQWVSALSIADHLQLAHIRSYAAKSVEDGLLRLDPFECIEVAERHRNPEWLLQPFRRICERAKPLSPSEMSRLGLDRASAVAEARENLMKIIQSRGLFDRIYGDSDPPSSIQTTLANAALQVVSADPLLSQLAPEHVTSTGAFRDTNAYPSQGLVTLPSDLNISEWEVFLKIITARPYDQPELSLAFSEWMSGLRVASKLNDDCATAYIFGQIQEAYPDQDAVDLLEAARVARAPHSQWLQNHYDILSHRSDAISPEEMRRIGVDALAEVCKLREQAAYDRGREDEKVASGEDRQIRKQAVEKRGRNERTEESRVRQDRYRSRSFPRY